MLLDLIIASMRDRRGWIADSKLEISTNCFFCEKKEKKREYTYNNVRSNKVQKRCFGQR